MRLRLQFVFLLVASCFIWSQPDAKAQSTDRNYVISRSYKVATTSTSGNVKDASQTVSYVDGLGRPIQSVLAHGSAHITGNVPGDLVTHVEYDSYNRISKNYGSYPVQGGNGVYQSNAPVKAVDYYNSGTNFCQPNNRGYEQLEYEQSHLNRVKKRYQIGSDRATEYSYGVNVVNEVKLYNVSESSVTTTKSYNAAELKYVETKDENGKRTREYKDKNDRVVLRRTHNGSDTLDTYFVYDNLSQLRFVLQPEYQESAELDKYSFKYEYNERGLVSSKYVPGGGTSLMYYDAHDRMTESVDGRGKITYFKYDDQNRVIEVGEKRGSVEEGLVKTHYDNYTPPFGNVDTFVDSGDGYSPTSRSNVTGYVTVTATRIINPNGDYGNWLYATTYYDDRYNVIQVIKGLFDIGSTSKEYHSKLVSFHGRVEKELIKQETGTGNYSVEKIYAYDHSDRLLSTRYLVKKGTATTSVTKKDIILSAVRYDGLGMPKSKFLFSLDNGSKFREQLDNCFVPTGWLSKVTGKTSASDNFGVELKYTNPSTAAAQYNGNIAEMLWRRGGSAWVGFKFTYDDVNRLTNAEGIDGNKYRETISEYDKNGNIKFLQRYDDTTPWDNLTYSYGDKGRLMKVTDSGSSNGFNNGSSGTDDDYGYDGNGNATKDLNRGIAAGNLSYNHLNLIREVIVNGQTVQYHYDGNGQKLRMSNTNGAVNTKYAGIFEYDKSNYVTRIATEEGQISVTNNGNDFALEFYLKDHLGNVRMVMNELGAMVQEMEYFPFGLTIPRIAGGNKYLYNGKEKQPETGLLDYGARQYDSSIGRWLSNDPLSEKTLEFNPFVYGNGNPTNMIDKNGGYAVSVHYDITFEALVSRGYSNEQADKIAHMASTYADHPTEPIRFVDHFGHNRGARGGLAYRKGIDYSATNDSQEPENAVWHSMMSNKEQDGGMTKEYSMLRGLKFGWDNIFAQGEKEDLGKLGQGLHALQDAYAHKGMSMREHLNFINFSAWKQTVGKDMYGSTTDASQITRSALIVLELVQGKKVNLKKRDRLNFSGMSSKQFAQIATLLFSQGYSGVIINGDGTEKW